MIAIAHNFQSPLTEKQNTGVKKRTLACPIKGYNVKWAIIYRLGRKVTPFT